MLSAQRKSNPLNFKRTINIQGVIMDLSTPKVMGILNVTPDSFYEKSRQPEAKDVVQKAGQMLEEGADILDVGGYSSRPGADDISEEEELSRAIDPIKSIKKQFPQSVVSIDTFRSRVAKEAVDAGADIINDISGGHLDDKMLTTVADLNVPYIAMHMKGTPQTMKGLATYDDIIKEMIYYFSEVVAKCKSLGIKDLILDPGFGFAKTIEQNFYLLNRLEYLHVLELPLLVGVSRKSMIAKTLNLSANDAINGTTALNTLALFKGASILRVHDIKEAVEVVKLVNRLH